MGINRIIRGDCLEVLPTFPGGSVDMVMTSPPYYGLRDYGQATERVWGDPGGCDHEWDAYLRPSGGGHAGKTAQVGNTRKGVQRAFGVVHGFCDRCGAWKGQLGLEPTWQLYIEDLVGIFGEVKRVLKRTGSMYVVIGDTYATGAGKSLNPGGDSKGGLDKIQPPSSPNRLEQPFYPSKCLMGIPWRFAFAMIDVGWILRNDVIWHKPSHMPSSVKDRLSNSYEHVFHFVKSPRYYYDLDAIRAPPVEYELKRRLREREQGLVTRFKNQKADKLMNPPSGRSGLRTNVKSEKYLTMGKNPGDVWSINAKPFKGEHFAVFPPELCERPIKSSCPPNGIVLDPMCGSGTVCLSARKVGRKFIGIDINPGYVEMAIRRLSW